ncbi:orotidine-5'-phosphate decarboxylase [Limosilactobacillus equigenerosi]|uniref:Orotidine 5'-phosphate decarboxylase n=1 Tax=Limosilactobacillus equigenerosi DSM 18793 = JCM 14505 TaxID=1423742 RepID=A0A0R1UKZ6_9LACO|nr:orotidine-5'-phosphate decarboxylase [Limosilactobacillus equigenerosi]KRL93985.1 orotidine 5-phosphate decarboxylase [Limosilactobacillus equigenerosi DSM 18793 = JCM 14505]
MQIKQPIIALDFPDMATTKQFLSQFPADEPLFVKVGMELYYQAGPDLIHWLKAQGHRIFLDLKCHDIPHTVYQAMKVIGQLGVDLTNVHAAGGVEMMRQAQQGLVAGAQLAHLPVPKLIAVTQLTSSDEQLVKNEQLSRVSLVDSVLNYAQLTQQAGLAGVVCSAQEAPVIKAGTNADFWCVTPGIRLAMDANQDQKRVMTPGAAAQNQATAIVVGRSITQAVDPVQAYQQVLQEWN